MRSFSLVIPCFNESGNIKELIKACHSIPNGQIEFIFVDNGSTDETFAELNSESEILERALVIKAEKNLGYGGGIKLGLSRAKGTFLGWTHADLQTNPRDLIQIIEWIQLNDNLALDTFYKGKRYGRPLSDKIFTFGMSLFESCIFLTNLNDINAQPTFFARLFYEKYIHSSPDDFSLDLYFYVMEKKDNLNIQRFPVNFGARSFGNSSWNTGILSKFSFIKRTISFSINLKLSFWKHDHN